MHRPPRLACLCTLALLAGGCGSWSGATHHVVLEQNAGLIAGDQVRMAGVVVGEVIEVKLDRAGDADIAIRVYEGTPLFQDAQAWIDPNNTFGPHHIVLESGISDIPLAAGASIPEAHVSYDVPDMLRGLGVATDDGPSLIPGAIQSLQTANFFLQYIAPLGEAPPDFDDKMSRGDQWMKDARAWTDERFPGWDQNIETAALWMLEQRVRVTLESFDKTLENAEKKLLPRLIELDRQLDELDTSLDAALAKSADFDADLATVLRVLKDLRPLLADYKQVDETTIQDLRRFTSLLRRVSAIKESEVRTFLQIEGVRSAVFGTSLEAADAIEEKTGESRDWSEW